MACDNKSCNCKNCDCEKCSCDGSKSCTCNPESTSCCCKKDN